jgi:hypothetical protein
MRGVKAVNRLVDIVRLITMGPATCTMNRCFSVNDTATFSILR